MSPSWHKVTSKESSGRGSASALAWCHSMETPGGAGIDRATASIPGIGVHARHRPVAHPLAGETGDVARPARHVEDALPGPEGGPLDEIGGQRGRNDGDEVVLVVLGRSSLEGVRSLPGHARSPLRVESVRA